MIQKVKNIISKITDVFNLYQKNILLENNNILLLNKIKELENRVPTAHEVVKRVFSNGIEYYDWNTLPFEERKIAFADAQKFLESPIINNIKNYLIATGAQAALLELKDQVQEIRDFRMTINGIELLFEELSYITDPAKDI